ARARVDRRGGPALGAARAGRRVREALPHPVRGRARRGMRIVHTEASLGWGGQEIRILSEAKGLIGRGHDVVLLCPAEARIYRDAPGWEVPAVALPIGAKRPKGVCALIRWFRGNGCDVVSTHSSTDSWLTAFTLLWLRRPFPMVRTRHISAP